VTARKNKKKPKARWWASPDMAEKMTGIYKVRLLGVEYELPIMRETLPIIRVLRGESKPWDGRLRFQWKKKSLAEKGMRYIIQTLLLQVEQTAAVEVSRDLMQEISDKMFPVIHGRVSKELEQKRLLSLAEGKPDTK